MVMLPTLTEDEDYWVRRAMELARQPHAWREEACRLKRAADKLLSVALEDFARLHFVPGWERDPERHWPDTNTYMMLIGLALENLAKGIRIVQASGEILQNDPKTLLKWSHAGDGHITPALLTQCNFPLTSDESRLVERLGSFVRWGGKYPVPKCPLRMKPVIDGAGRRESPNGFSSHDVPIIDSLWKRLLSHLDTLAAGWVVEEQVRQAAEKRARREDALRALLGNTFERLDIEGVIYFQHREPVLLAGTGTAVVSCVQCGKQAVLTEQRPAGVCGCGTLHYARVKYDGQMGQYTMHIESYPIERDDGGASSGETQSPSSRNRDEG